jgi:hypothetical protein
MHAGALTVMQKLTVLYYNKVAYASLFCLFCLIVFILLTARLCPLECTD